MVHVSINTEVDPKIVLHVTSKVTHTKGSPRVTRGGPVPKSKYKHRLYGSYYFLSTYYSRHRVSD